MTKPRRVMTPEQRAALSEAQRKAWANPEYRANKLAALRRAGEQRWRAAALARGEDVPEGPRDDLPDEMPALPIIVRGRAVPVSSIPVDWVEALIFGGAREC